MARVARTVEAVRHVARMAVLGGGVGVLAGLSSALFLETLAWATDTREAHGWLLYLLPVAGLVLGVGYLHLAGTAAAGNNLINLYDSRWDFNEDGWNEVRTHSKFVLVRGNYEGNRKKWVVMTGSPNWVAGSLSKGDESTLNIELKGAYGAYLNNWEKIRRNSRKLPYNQS